MLIKLLTSFLSLSSLKDDFNNYLNKFNKNYTENEYWRRLDIYVDNINYINKHNQENHSYLLGLTPFTDISNEEFQSDYVLKNNDNPCTLVNTGHFLFPRKHDWRNESAVTSVKNQLQCGGCWAFSTVEAIEGIRAIKYNSLVSLSEQQLIDCSIENKGCNGGSMDLGFNYVIENGGLCSNHSYPYQAQDGNCDNSCEVIKHTDIQKCYDILPKKERLFLSYLSQQPLSVAIQANGMTFQHYKEGIYDDINCYSGQLDHGVLAVAYDEETITLKNSWGVEWGNMGYIDLARIGNGAGICGVLMLASYPSY